MAADGTLEPGQLFAGDFEIVRVVHEGGLSTIYEVVHRSSGAHRALKVAHGALGAEPAVRDRFLEEARRAAKIASDHVADVIACGVDDATGAPYVAMELVSGESLAKRVERLGPLPAEEALEVMRQLGHALAAAHDLGLVHRDLKPEAILIADTRSSGPGFRVVVQFVGLGKIVSEVKHNTTAAMSRPLFMAPEQAETDAKISPATDVWTLGLLAFYVLTGRPYWKTARDMGSGMMRVMREVLFDPLPAASERAVALGLIGIVPVGLDTWFSGCVDRDPRKRHPHAREALAALERALEAGAAHPAPATAGPAVGTNAPKAAPEPARPTSPGRRPPRKLVLPTLGRRSRWIGAGVVAVVGLGSLGALFYGEHADEARRDEARRAEDRRALERESDREREVNDELEKDESWAHVDCPIPVTGKDPWLGHRDAPVTIVVFGDLGSATTERALRAALPLVDGRPQYRLVFKHAPKSSDATDVAVSTAAEAVLQAKGRQAFFRFAQAALRPHRRNRSSAHLEELAEGAGVPRADFDAALRDPSVAEKVLTDRTLAQTLGVDPPPVVFVNGERIEATTAIGRALEEAVARQLEKAKQRLQSGTAKDELYSTLTRENFSAPTPVARPTPTTPDATVFQVPVGDAPSRGPETALVTVVHFVDFESALAKKGFDEMKRLRSELGDRVRWVHRDRPRSYHKHAEDAAMAAREVRAQKGIDAFWRMHDELAENPRALEMPDLEGYARRAGADVEKFRTAFVDRRHAAGLQSDIEVADGLKTVLTPTFFVNGRKVRVVGSSDALERVILEEEAKARVLVASGTAPRDVYDAIMKAAR